MEDGQREGMNEANQRTKILIVDDMSRNIDLLKMILSREGFQIHVAKNGIKALEVANAVVPNLILLDVVMPQMDGFETCQKLKASPETKEIPVIFLTGRTDSDDVVKGFELGAVDYVTKPFKAEELLARAYTHLELKRKEKRLLQLTQDVEVSYQTIRKQQKQLVEGLEQARKTQLSILPERPPEIPNAKVAFKYVPMEQIGGDFYDVFELEEGTFGLVIADVTGHGVPAALLSFMFSSMFSNACASGTSPGITLRLTNGYVENKVEEEKFATMFYVVYEASTQQLTYSGAAHPCALIIRPSSNEILELHSRGTLIGCFSHDFANFEEDTVQLLSGDRLLLYTDGIIEVLNPKEEMLGSPRLKSFVLENQHLGIEELLEQIYELVHEWSGDSGVGDDITMMGLEVQ